MIGEALRLLRVFNDVKLVSLANDLSISPSYLSEIENGKRKPNLEIVERYAARFNVRPSAILFFGEEIQNAPKSGKVKNLARSKMIKLMQVIETHGQSNDAQTQKTKK